MGAHLSSILAVRQRPQVRRQIRAKVSCDRYFPEKLPPLQISSRPVNVGMLIGDIVSLPWYRTVFTNLGNVIAPETLPPLELESRPVDVGELISDQMGHLWWTSLLRNLAAECPDDAAIHLQLGRVLAAQGKKDDANVVDAEFTEVDDDKKNKKSA